MSTVEETLITALSSISDVKAFPLLKPINERLPAIVYQRISTGNLRTHTGNSDLNKVRMQVSCWANTYKEAKTLALQVKNLLDMDTTNFEVSYLEDQREFIDSDGFYNIQFDFYIFSNGD